MSDSYVSHLQGECDDLRQQLAAAEARAERLEGAYRAEREWHWQKVKHMYNDDGRQFDENTEAAIRAAGGEGK